MNEPNMSMFNDDGIPLNLNTVFMLFFMPNLMFIFLTIFNIFLVCLSKKHPRLDRLLGRIANFFAKGALDRIVKNMLRRFQEKNRQQQQHELIPMVERESNAKESSTSSNASHSEKKYDANYLFLLPFQLDLLLTVLIFKILTRDVYPETCQSFLTTYVNREAQVVCWLRHVNKNISNLSFNISLQRYCINQTITFINFEHNDVICIQYVFKLINIIDTVTNIFAWHQAIVFIVTKAIVFAYWYQQKLSKTSCWSKLSDHHRRIVLFILISSTSLVYILIFVLVFPVYFVLTGRIRIDLTRHLLYACSKFLVAIIVHVNLYTLYQWHLYTARKKQLLTANEGKEIEYERARRSMLSIRNSEHKSIPGTMMTEDYLGSSSANYLTPNVSV